MLIEINTGGTLEFLRLATGRGFSTEKVQALLRECGFDPARHRPRAWPPISGTLAWMRGPAGPALVNASGLKL